MTSIFNIPEWQRRVAAWWQANARDLPGAMQRLGVRTAYGLLTASAWLPVLTAYSADPGAATMALANLMSGVGTNLLANLVQNKYDETTAPRQAEREVAEQPELRAEYQQMLAGLNVVAAAQAALGQQWGEFEQQLRGELARMGGELRIESGGGAVILGNVQVQYGDFVGRDKIEYHYHTPADAPPTQLLQTYYRHLAHECSRLPLGVVHRNFARPDVEGEVQLADVYIDLDVVSLAPAEGRDERRWLRLARGEEQGRTPLLQAIAQPDARRLALLGDAGSGKTTFVSYLTYLLADAVAGGASPPLPAALQGALPIRLVLRNAAVHIPATAECGNAAMVWNGLRADVVERVGQDAANRLFPYLQEQAIQRGLFLFDGLDEVPEADRRRRCLLEAIQHLLDSLPPERRILLTARPYAYADPQWRLPRFTILELAPFNPDQVERFVGRWYQAVRPAMGWDAATAGSRGKGLLGALKGRSYLADLASRPLLLTLIATVESSGGKLPEDRADLYKESVELLLSRWQRWREVRGPDGKPVVEPGIARALGVGEERIRQALEQLALQTHTRQREQTRDKSAAADIPASEVLAAFSPLLPEDLNPRVLLDYLETRAGLLIGRGKEMYAFLHRSFQEYLAACCLTNQSDFARKVAELVNQDMDWWREVFLLSVGQARQGGLSHAVGVVNVLLPQDPDGAAAADKNWRAAILAGQALLELRLPDKAADDPYYLAILERARRWLVELVEGGRLSPRERAEAGDVLGKLGDPRFDPAFYFLPARYRGQPEPFYGFVEIPAGPFTMGSHKDDEEAENDEKPPAQVETPRYWIARYPVTVAQFGAFIESGGYDRPDWWTTTGWAWRQGEWDSAVQQAWLRDWLKRRPPDLRSRPMRWEEQTYPNRPVVGVTWFEAIAYCRWLTAQLQSAIPNPQYPIPNTQWIVRLPTEAEWEKAARGEAARRYAWGNEDWDEERANIDASNIGHPTPVGMYPRGATPSGLHDMTGNVWEWTQSIYRPYPYADDDRNDPEAEGNRVVRGGTWGNNQICARCAYRDWYLPDAWNGNVGFRVVVSLAFS